MSAEVFTTYLNDHLAGSVAALELVGHLLESSKGTARENLFVTLKTEIEADQVVLQDLLRQAGGRESKVRRAAAWLGEKLGEAKLKIDDTGTGELALLEALETLALGIQGKLALWRALEAARGRRSEIQKLDLATLKSRAIAQHERVDAERLRVARLALSA